MWKKGSYSLEDFFVLLGHVLRVSVRDVGHILVLLDYFKW
jgi:hypothetical protein